MKSKLYLSKVRKGRLILSAIPPVVAAFTMVLSPSAKAIDWDGGGDGVSFGDAANWAGDALPDASQEAALGANSATVDSGTFAVDWVSATSGSLTMTGGSITMDYNAGFGANFGTEGGSVLTMSGSSLVTMSNMNLWRIGSGAYEGTTTLNMSDEASIVRNGGGYLVLGNGNFSGTMSGNSSITSDASEFYIGDGNGNDQTATLAMFGTSTISVTGGRLVVASGGQTNSTITLQDSSSISITSTDASVIGGGGAASVTLNDSSSFDAAYLKIGDGNGSGLVTMNDTASMDVTNLTIGHYAGAASTGTLDMNGPGTVLNAGNIVMGRDDSAGGAMSSYLNVNGGTVITNSIQHGGGDAGTEQIVTFDGGVLQAASSTSEFFSDTAAPSSNVELMVMIAGGGMTFNTAEFDVATAQSFTGVGGLTKDGTGTLHLLGDNTFTGGVTVLDGAMSLESVAALSSSTVLDLATGTALELFYGEGTIFIDSLLIDGTDLNLSGTYTAEELAALTDAVTFTGDSGSTLTIGMIPEPSVLALSGLMALGLLRRSRRA